MSPRRKQPLTGRAALLATLTEKEWQRQVCEWATHAGYRIYHTADSRRAHAGFPDLVLVKPGRPVIFAELKTINGRISPMQRIWLDDLQHTSGYALVCLWRPDMEAEVKAVLNSTYIPPNTLSALAAGRSDAAEDATRDRFPSQASTAADSRGLA